MTTCTIKSEVVNSVEVFEGVKFEANPFSDLDHVKIQIGGQEVLVDKNTFLQVSDMIRDAKVSNRRLNLRIREGKIV